MKRRKKRAEPFSLSRAFGAAGRTENGAETIIWETGAAY